MSPSFLVGTAAGYDQITINVIKEIIDLIVQTLTYITNLSLSSGTVPDPMKIARVVPLFKTGDSRKRLFYNRLINFLNKFNILAKNHSTAYALIQLYAKISDAINEGKVTLVLFINLSWCCITVGQKLSFW